MAISPVSLDAVLQHSRITNAKMKFDKVMNTIRSNISEAYKVQVDCWEDLESDSYDKNDMKETANELVRFHDAMQEKLATTSYSEQIQILTLVLDKLSRNYYSEYLNAFNILYELQIKSKKVLLVDAMDWNLT